MKDGFIKTAAITTGVWVADCLKNRNEIITKIREAGKEGAKVIVTPELAVTAYTCADLFFQKTLTDEALNSLVYIAKETAGVDAISFVGLPLMQNGKLYNCAAALNRGKILAFIPKSNIPNHNGLFEARYFSPGPDYNQEFVLNGEKIPFGYKIVFVNKDMPEFTVGAEICQDLWSIVPPSAELCKNGANIIVNLSASNEEVGKESYRRELVKIQSSRCICGYVLANAGEGESSTDLVFSGHNIISENGTVLCESERFKNQTVYSEIDVFKIESQRKKTTTYKIENTCLRIDFETKIEKTNLTRSFSRVPFVPSDVNDRKARCEEILNIQSMGLKKRLTHINCKTAVIGISGGLDSTLALFVTARAFDKMGKNRKDIIGITMPCFGTTNRTYSNAISLVKELGATLIEIPIKDAVNQHFKDIGHNNSARDVTYENAQARERTQVIMDVANKTQGLAVGTGDLSELALGWATYNGDHMSAYGVNASVPKSLVRYLVQYIADSQTNKIKSILYDILDTPVSPELLPSESGDISQKTESIVGPYELHDFFIYNVVRFGFSPAKIHRIAEISFKAQYTSDEILKWEKYFYKRFFSQQFKRSCMPDGPKLGSVGFSPRSDFHMPSDACVSMWLNELDRM